MRNGELTRKVCRVVRSAVGANSNATGVLELMDDTRSFALALLEDCNK